MAQDEPKGASGGNKPKPGGNTPKPAAGQSAKDKSRAQSRPITGKPAAAKGGNTPRPPAKSSGGGNKPRPGRPAASATKAPRGAGGALIAWGAVGLVVIIIAVLVIVKLTGGNSTTSASYTPVTTAPASIVHDVTSVPASVFNTVGVNFPSSATVNPPTVLTGQPPLTLDGKTPAMLYYGAEYCPYCSAERWGLVVALSRFGTWSGLQVTASSHTDIYPATPTFSLVKATLTSPYLTFFPVETCSNVPDASNTGCNGYTSLQAPTKEELAVMTKYSSSTYLPNDTNPAGEIGFPFIDIGNKALISGATYDPQILNGLTHEDIAGNLDDTSNSVTQAIIGTANYMSAAICASTSQQPSDVCTSPGVKAAAKSLKLG